VTCDLDGHPLKMKLDEDVPGGAISGWITFPPSRTRLYADDRLIA
jgi:glycerol transport system ATP-binding protein